MKILVPGDASVERITVTVRRSVDGGAGWTTVEVQAEASVTHPARWDDQARRLSEQLERLVEERLKAQQVRPRSQRGNGNNGNGRGHLADRFWRVVYGAGLSNKDGHSILAEVGGDFEAALRLFRQRQQARKKLMAGSG